MRSWPKARFSLTIMLRVPITLKNETTTPVGRVALRVTRQKCIKNVGLRRSAPNPTYKFRMILLF